MVAAREPWALRSGEITRRSLEWTIGISALRCSSRTSQPLFGKGSNFVWPPTFSLVIICSGNINAFSLSNCTIYFVFGHSKTNKNYIFYCSISHTHLFFVLSYPSDIKLIISHISGREDVTRAKVSLTTNKNYIKSIC